MNPLRGSVATRRTRRSIADVEPLLALDDAPLGGRREEPHEGALVGVAPVTIASNSSPIARRGTAPRPACA